MLINDLLTTWDHTTQVLVHAVGDDSVHPRRDAFSRLMEALFIGALFLVALASNDRYRSTPAREVQPLCALQQPTSGRPPHLLLTCALGMTTVALAENLFVLFVGLELAGFSSYILVAFNKESKFGSEGGMKYFMVGSLPPALASTACLCCTSGPAR